MAPMDPFKIMEEGPNGNPHLQYLKKMPRDWKTANVAPILKKGEKYKESNYHPVSLSCILCKCMEHIVASQAMQHLTMNNILYNHQHDFRPKLSTET